MDLPTIAMEPEAAQERLEKYRAMRPDRMTDEDRATAAGYRALAGGLTLVDLAVAMKGAGLGVDHRPRLAIARADVAAVKFSAVRGGICAFFPADRNSWNPRSDAKRVSLPAATFAWPQNFDLWKLREAVAWTPTIPPEHRPARTRMKDFHVLWEAVWEPTPPVDPFLLRRLAGTLYVVVAQWDLTPLERAVMGGRITAGLGRN